jgi:hypothetical protein
VVVIREAAAGFPGWHLIAPRSPTSSSGIHEQDQNNVVEILSGGDV